METRRIHEVVHSLRQKPEHIRQRMALGVAGGTTLLVALGWFGVMVTGGAFSLATTNIASTDGSSASAKGPTLPTQSNFTELLGAASAAIGATTSPPEIKVVDTKSASTLDSNAISPDQTVIHY